MILEIQRWSRNEDCVLKKYKEEEKTDQNDGELVHYVDYLTNISILESFVNVLNPCGHTGFESISCDICGYPDPRKLIKYLKEKVEELQKASLFEYNNSLNVIGELQEENERLKEKIIELNTDIDGENTEFANRAVNKIKEGIIREVEKISEAYFLGKSRREWDELRKALEWTISNLEKIVFFVNGTAYVGKFEGEKFELAGFKVRFDEIKKLSRSEEVK